MLVTSKKYKELEKEVDLLKEQNKFLFEYTKALSERIDDIQHDLEPPLTMGGK